jgi:hypothetical protein
MSGVIARILMRVIAGFMIARGMPADLVEITRDPALALDIQAAIGAGIWALTELYYVIAKRLGWAT